MAATSWSIVLVSALLSWWLSGTTRGALAHQELGVAPYLMPGLDANGPGMLESAPEQLPNSPASGPWEQVLRMVKAQHITPYMLRQVLRSNKMMSPRAGSGSGNIEVPQWPGQKPLDHKRWLDSLGGPSVESRFPLPERRQFPEIDWRGFNEDVFHESFGDFNPMKRWRRSAKA